MGKVKELYMDIQEKTWEAIEKNPSIGFEELVKEVSVASGLEEKFIAPIVEEEYLDYKRGYGADEGQHGADEAQYLNEMETAYEGK